MNIHEYQAKAVLRDFGVAVPRGKAAFSVEEAVKAAADLGSPVVVVKAQIHAGGRGKAGGVKVVKSQDEVRKEAQRLLTLAMRESELASAWPSTPAPETTSDERSSAISHH